MLTDTSEWAGTTLCDGRYRVLRKLGEGGMAHVYVAHDDKLERDVIIKVPRANLIHDANFAGRFTREVRSLAKLAHPHVVPLIDIGQHDGVPFAVMHYLTGGSLRDRQPRGPDGKYAPMPVDNLHSWLAPIAQALDFVHKNKYIHRDVKPENILFDEDGQVFLSDLGIIKALSEPQDQSQSTVLTGAGMVLGTPHYMAPELILGETVDGRADQYALGITLYEVLTGQFPFNGASAPAIFIQQTTKAPPPIRDLAPNIPPRLVAAIEKAMAKAPRERYATCVEFVQSAIGAGGSGAHSVAKTVLEHQAFRDEPAMESLLGPSPQRIDTPSDLRNPTRAMTSPAAQLRPQAPRRSSRAWLIAGLATIVIAGAVAAFVLTPGSPPELKLAEVKSLSLLPGDKQPIRVEVDRQRLDGDVACWLEGLPDSIKTERLLLPAGKSAGMIDVAIPSDAAPRTVTATLKAKCQNVETSRPVEITINAPLAEWRFLPISPRTMKAGEISTVLAHIERKNCEGPVDNLVLEGLPAGVSWLLPKFITPVIPAELTSYPFELKAAANAPSAFQAKVIVKGKLKAIPAEGAFLLTIVAAPSIPKDSLPPEIIVKKTTPTPEPKKDPEKEAPKVIVKAKEKEKEPEKPKPPPVVVKTEPPELILAPMLPLFLQPGDRKTTWVQIERKNCAGPVNIEVAGLPLAGGVTVAPAPLETIPATRLATSFELIVDPMAPPSNSVITVSAALGDLRAKYSFKLDVRKPVPQVKKVPPPPNNLPLLVEKVDKLTENDPLDTVKKTSRAKSFPVYLVAGKTYTIDMVSDAFDSYLRIEKVKGVSLAENDNDGGGLNARIVFSPQTEGIHHVVGTSVAPGSLGPYTITVR